MSALDLILAIDIGGDSIKAAEFAFPPEGGIVLQKFAYREYGNEIDEESPSSTIFAAALRELILSNKFSAKKTYLSLSGQNAFIRFVKVPAVTSDQQKIKSIIEYEAKQTIPFPMNEVVWDAQQIESSEIGSPEIEAMFVIMKNEEVLKVTDVLEGMGLDIALIEIAPTACYNTARANMIGEDQCEMILNIGGHCSTLVFVDGGRFFVRTIPIAGHTITQQISKEFGISFADAEEMKRRHGFVALGGAYEEPESEVAATVSKIVRNVMTRLHGEINRSVNVYRAQQKGRRPEKLYLAGGSSVMAFTPRFFSEKLHVPVEYFNPFQIITLAPGVERERLAEVAHLFAEPIGLALRYLGSCQMHISLIPDSVRKQNDLKMKTKYFYASAFLLICCLGITYWGYSSQLEFSQHALNEVQKFVGGKQEEAKRVRKANDGLTAAKNDYEAAQKILTQKYDWVTLYNELQKILPDNVWFNKITLQSAEPQGTGGTRTAARAFEQPMGMFSPAALAAARRGNFNTDKKEKAPEGPVTEDLQWVILEGGYALTADQKDDEAYEVLLYDIKASPYFIKDNIVEIGLGSTIENNTNIASFKIGVKLREPIKYTK